MMIFGTSEPYYGFLTWVMFGLVLGLLLLARIEPGDQPTADPMRRSLSELCRKLPGDGRGRVIRDHRNHLRGKKK